MTCRLPEDATSIFGLAGFISCFQIAGLWTFAGPFSEIILQWIFGLAGCRIVGLAGGERQQGGGESVILGPLAEQSSSKHLISQQL
jgi:hypothetical protein